MRQRWIQIAACLAVLAPPPAWALGPVGEYSSQAGIVRVVSVAEGLDTPWSLGFLPDGWMVVTERPGRMRRISPDGALSPPLAGVPAVHAEGQGGLLDVVPSPKFASDRLLYFSFAQPTATGARTAVARGRLAADGTRLEDVQVIFAQREDPPGRHHFGSRLVFARDGSLFITLGERNTHRTAAQDLDSHLGKVVRILPDGGVPADNPFVGRPNIRPEIWSYGHRNVQGAALHPATGALWTGEHGPQGGDELNLDLPGRNYGWPVITFGREYVTGFQIGEGTARSDVEGPRHQWTPSIAPSGLAFYTGEDFPGWRGSAFVGSLKFRYLARLSLRGSEVTGEERLLVGLGARLRDVRQGPDGRLYLVDESGGRILRLERGN
ncbi:MAG: PQQ-dependent sugar dehydrogenase [Zoogloeaceae bacterium]|nr:PQQ-dependent sugar dehydrogenase [Zoogloeaceae bacterium]